MTVHSNSLQLPAEGAAGAQLVPKVVIVHLVTTCPIVARYRPTALLISN